MVSIASLMTKYKTSKRKIRAVADNVGIQPIDNDSYPDEFEAILGKALAEKPKKSLSTAACENAEQTVTSIAQEDLQAIQSAAEQRAAAITVGLNALTMHHVATGKFSDPQLQAIVDESKNNLRVALAGIGAAYQITDFLAATPLLQIAGGNGSRNLLSGSETSAESSDAELLTA